MAGSKKTPKSKASTAKKPKPRTKGRRSPVHEIPDWVLEEALALAKAGAPQPIIAERLKIHPHTFSKWMRWGNEAWEPREGDEAPLDREPYRVFREQIRHAQAQPVVMCEAVWLKAVQEGDWKAAERWAKLHRPDLYKESVEVELTGSLANAADEALESIRAMVENATQRND